MKHRSALLLVLGIFIFLATSFSQTEIKLLPHEPDSVLNQPDWLIDHSSYKAGLYRTDQENLVLSNGLIRREFCTKPNGATVAFDNLMTGESIIRGIRPEAEISIDGRLHSVGGLIGQPNHAFLLSEWIDGMQVDEKGLQFIGFESGEISAPFAWKQVRHHDSLMTWPPPGVHLVMTYRATSLEALVHYELYDGLPVICKWLEVINHSNSVVKLDSFSSEILAVVEYASTVETREFEIPTPNIHVETDYAFASMNADDANHHVVHWESDPLYTSQVNYLKGTPCLLRVSPELGPAQILYPQDTFRSYRCFILPHDSYERERQGLAQRRMYRTLAPWTTENPLMMHARFADWERVKTAIDQAAAVGFEMIILTFGSGFDIENRSEEYLTEMQKYSAYAKSQGVELGGYSLLASRSIDAENDVVMPAGERPVFGNAPCLASTWGQAYFDQLYHFYENSGFTLLEHDGSYPGDFCASTQHPGHIDHADSRWNQYQLISDFYKWCRAKGIYLNIPDYYFLTGGNKIAMGYREVNWSLPRAQQVIHTRQNIYDGTWTKNVTMGWMFVPLTEYHGGGAEATIEPLHENLDHYAAMMISNLGAGVQACYRGPRLYDEESTERMVAEQVAWFKQHRNILEGDLIHLRRADGRDLDYWLLVRPGANEKAALVVFNPLDQGITKKITVPLYYSGIENDTRIFEQGDYLGTLKLDRKFQVELSVTVEANSWNAFFFE